MSHGFCNAHSHKFRKYGNPLFSIIKLDLDTRLKNNIKENMTTGCHEWTGLRNEFGYGIININKKHIRVHRLIYKQAFGEIPEGMFICHHCDNPSCCNLSHLFLGSPKDNHQDMTYKNRQVIPLGEHNGKSKLNEIDMTAIKIQLKNKVEGALLARLFYVDKKTIYQIRDEKTWKHIVI